VYLIRHAKTRGNIEKRYIGATDQELAQEGIRELVAKKSRYPDVELVFASPMKRSVQTAQLIYAAKEARLMDGLRECDFGAFENKTYEDLKDDSLYRAWIDSGCSGDIPQGENADAFRRRCGGAFEDILEEMKAENAETAAIVAHGGTFMSILEKYTPENLAEGRGFYEWRMENCEMMELIIKDNRIIEIRRAEKDAANWCSSSAIGV
jgi:alpha-ribazole phosphatase